MPSIPQVRSVVGFPGYRITRNGTVISTRRNRLQKLQLQIDSTDRFSVSLYKDGRPHTRTIHRLVLEAFAGPCPAGMEACHNNGNHFDNRLKNLRWDTHSENTYDSLRHGTFSVARLTQQQVQQIMVDCDSGQQLQREIATKYGVKQSTVSRIANHRTWKHLWT